MMVNEVANIVDAGISAFEQDDDLDMLEKAFPANIKLLEVFLANSPNTYNILVLLSKFYASYAFVFFEGKLEVSILNGDAPEPRSDRGKTDFAILKKTVNRYYRKGADYALRALEARYSECRDRLKAVSTRDRFFDALTIEDVPALFWYGFNLGAFVNLNRDSVKAISKAPLAEKAMKRVIELEPAYYHGGAHLFLLSYYASRPPMLGGNLKSALQHYREIKKLTGEGYLLPDLYYARYYLYQKQDRKKYGETLSKIIHSPETQKTYRLHNKIAVIRAKNYLGAIDQLFE